MPLLAIAAAVGVLYEAWTHDWGGIREIVQGAWNEIHPIFDAFGRAFDTLRNALRLGGISGAFAAIPARAGARWRRRGQGHGRHRRRALQHGLGRGGQPLLAGLQSLLGRCSSVGSLGNRAAAQPTGSWGQAFVAWIPGATVRFLQQWPGMLSRFLDWIAEAAQPIATKLVEWAGAFVAWVAPHIPDILKALGLILAALVVFIAETANTIIMSWPNGAWPSSNGWRRRFRRCWRSWASSCCNSEAGCSTRACPRWRAIYSVGAVPSWPGSARRFRPCCWSWPSSTSGSRLWMLETLAKITIQLGKWAVAFVAWVAPKIPGLLLELAKLYVRVEAWMLETLAKITLQLAKWALAFVAWISPMIPKALAALAGLGTQFATWLGQEAASLAAWGLQLAGDLVGGLLQGFKNKLGDLKTGAKNLVTDGIQSVWNNTLGRLSPSKWARDFGVDVGQGLINGLASMGNAVGAAAGAMASGVQGGITTAATPAQQANDMARAQYFEQRASIDHGQRARNDIKRAQEYLTKAGVTNAPGMALAAADKAKGIVRDASAYGFSPAATSTASAIAPAATGSGVSTGSGDVTVNITIARGAITVDGAGASAGQERDFASHMKAAIEAVVRSQLLSEPGTRLGVPGVR